MSFPFGITEKVLGMMLTGSLVLSVALGSGWALSNHRLSNAKEVIQSLTEWQDGIVETTRLATGSDEEVTAETAQLQIQQLGLLRVELKGAVETQNTAIEALAKESDAARAVAAQAEKQRRSAIQRSEVLAAKLREQAAVPEADTDAAVRRTQDEVYEAGL